MKGARAHIVAEFGNSGALVRAAREARARGFEPVDALTPCPVEDVEEALGLKTSPIRWPMLFAAVGVAALAYALEVWSAVFAYPFDSGGRPPNSWPIFLLVPFEVGVLAAALAGFIALIVLCGLPRLHHPLFDLPSVERATDDRYLLVVEAPREESEAERLRALLGEAHALTVGEVVA